jgi:hypothetical protein
MLQYGMANPFFSMTTRQALWGGKAHWPDDSLGKIFLPRAIVRFGAMVAQNWTGQEPAVDHKEPLPEHNVVGTTVEQHRYATQILRELNPGYFERAEPFGLFGGSTGQRWYSSDPMPNDAEWLFAFDESKRRATATRPQVDRYRYVCELLKHFLQHGTAPAYERDLHGDRFREIDPAKWIGEHLQFRFDLARYCVSKPFDPRAVEYGGTWIFLDAGILDAIGHEIQINSRAQQAAATTVAATKHNIDEFYCWLVGEMKASPASKPHAKNHHAQIASERFGVGPRKFGECWQQAIEATGADSWARSGAPSGPRKSNRVSNPAAKS